MVNNIYAQLQELITTKTLIKSAIESKGQEVSSTDTFRSYADKINNISGGSTINNQDITITENGEYTADEGYTGLGTVTVNVSGSNELDAYIPNEYRGETSIGTKVLVNPISYYDVPSDEILRTWNWSLDGLGSTYGMMPQCNRNISHRQTNLITYNNGDELYCNGYLNSSSLLACAPQLIDSDFLLMFGSSSSSGYLYIAVYYNNSCSITYNSSVYIYTKYNVFNNNSYMKNCYFVPMLWQDNDTVWFHYNSSYSASGLYKIKKTDNNANLSTHNFGGYFYGNLLIIYSNDFNTFYTMTFSRLSSTSQFYYVWEYYDMSLSTGNNTGTPNYLNGQFYYAIQSPKVVPYTGSSTGTTVYAFILSSQNIYIYRFKTTESTPYFERCTEAEEYIKNTIYYQYEDYWQIYPQVDGSVYFSKESSTDNINLYGFKFLADGSCISVEHPCLKFVPTDCTFEKMHASVNIDADRACLYFETITADEGSTHEAERIYIEPISLQQNPDTGDLEWVLCKNEKSNYNANACTGFIKETKTIGDNNVATVELTTQPTTGGE